MKPAARPGRRKNPLLVLLPIVLIGSIVFFLLEPWMRRIDLKDVQLSVLARINVLIWVFVLWWSVHHMVFQMAALFRVPRMPSKSDAKFETKLALLYLTCDDFLPNCCYSCVEQDYPPELVRIVVCDDSRTPGFKSLVDSFVKVNPQVALHRRETNQGFKAGNLNSVLGSGILDDVDWVVILDADQTIPADFLRNFSEILERQPADIAFVQAGHDPERTSERNESTGKKFFQAALSSEVWLFYERDLSWRQGFGFLPFLGHGGAIRRSLLKELGGFPEVVSEDYAFSLRARNEGFFGVYQESVRSTEAFPKDFGAFIVRLRKFSSGSAELFRREVGAFLKGRASLTEKLDFIMLLAWFPALPLIVANGFLSGYVCGRWWEGGIRALHPVLPYLFLAMFFGSIGIIASVTDRLSDALRYWFWAMAVYGAAMPVAAWNFLIHLLRKPRFHTTPKGDAKSPRLVLASCCSVLLGLCAVLLAYKWLSPFSPVLAANGMAYLSFPLYLALDRSGPIGWLARRIVWAPGLLFVTALWTMWYWGRV